MAFSLNDEQKQIKALVKDFCDREIDPKRIKEIEDKVYNAKTCDEVRSVFPRDLLEKLYEVGLRQLAIPEKYGGTAPEESGNITRAIAAEEMGYWSGGAAVLLATPLMVCKCSTASSYVTEEQREQFFQHFWETQDCSWEER